MNSETQQYREAAWREKKFSLYYLKERLPSTPTELTSDAWLGEVAEGE